MKLNNLAIKNIILVSAFFIILPLVLKVKAADKKDLESVGVDSTLIREDKNFAIPEQIIITPLFQPSNDGIDYISQKDWIRGIYYYLIERLGFSDIPFHYIVTDEGEIYTGNQGGDERKINITGAGEKALVIAYLTKSGSTKFSDKASTAIQNLLIELCNKNSIKPENISVSGLRFIKDDTQKTVNLASKEIFGLWNQNLNQIIVAITPSYSPVPRTYTVEASNLEMPTDQVEPGETVLVKLKLKNTGSSGIYSASDSEIVLSRKDSDQSSFYINNIWPSKSQIALLPENTNLLPQDEFTTEFKIRAPLAFGQVSELFELKTITGNLVQSSPVQITLTMKRTDKQIVEVKNTELGYANVRAEPSTGSNVLIKASTGERFFLLEEDLDTLWAKIDIGDGRTGWVALWLISKI